MPNKLYPSFHSNLVDINFKENDVNKKENHMFLYDCWKAPCGRFPFVVFFVASTQCCFSSIFFSFQRCYHYSDITLDPGQSELKVHSVHFPDSQLWNCLFVFVVLKLPFSGEKMELNSEIVLFLSCKWHDKWFFMIMRMKTVMTMMI